MLDSFLQRMIAFIDPLACAQNGGLRRATFRCKVYSLDFATQNRSPRAGGMGALAPMVTAVWQCQNPHQADPRSAVLAHRWPSFAPEDNGCFRASRTHARTRSRTLLTIERTCPAGASWSLPLGQPSNCCAVQRAGVFSLRSFSIFYFVTRLAQHPGQLPPARRARGGIYGCRGGAASGLRNVKCARP